MYTNHFGLRAKPFGLAPDPRSFYESSRHKPVLESALAAIEENRGVVVLTGPAGVGKTALVRKLLGRLPPQMDALFLQYTNLDLDGLLGLLLDELGLEQLGGPRLEQYELLRRGLAERCDAGEPVLLLVDEAQNLCAEALGVLLRLVRECREEGSGVQLMLVGQPELEDSVRDSVTGRTPGAVAEWLRLEPLPLEDLGPLVRHRLQVVGCRRDDLFDPEAFDRLYRYTEGNPRLLNLLCDHALMHACAERAASVDAEIVDRVADVRLHGESASADIQEQQASPDQEPGWRELAREATKRVQTWLSEPLLDFGQRRRLRDRSVSSAERGKRRLHAVDWVPMAAVGGGVLLLALVLLVPRPQATAEEQPLALTIPEPQAPATPSLKPGVQPERIDPVRAVALRMPAADAEVAAATGAQFSNLEQMSTEDLRAQLLDLHQALDQALSEQEMLTRDLESLRAEREALLARLADQGGSTATSVAAPSAAAPPAPKTPTTIDSAPALKADSSGHYVAQPGDTLWSVARAHDLSVPELLALNSLSSGHLLRSGEELQVREVAADAGPDGLVTSGGGVVEAPPQRYTVRRGDTLYGISRRFNVSVGELSHWNGLSASEPLLAGQRLVVYSASGA